MGETPATVLRYHYPTLCCSLIQGKDRRREEEQQEAGGKREKAQKHSADGRRETQCVYMCESDSERDRLTALEQLFTPMQYSAPT